MSTSVTDIQISAVCHEARTEYLFANPHFLITDRGRIYYNPDTTIIHIVNWSIMGHGVADAITENLLLGLHVDEWVTEIKRLAVGKVTLMNDMRHVTLMTGLRQLIAVWCTCKEFTHPNIDFSHWLKLRKEVLEKTISRIAPDFNVPQFSVFKEALHGAEWYHAV